MDNALDTKQNGAGNKNRKVLFRIRNLKQYFPVRRKRNTFVKANDGITIDIYEGETLGIVGESGCGKSTLGRTLLQLYHQTDGETLYFGVPRDSIAPGYVLDVYENLERKCNEARGLMKSADKLEKECDEIAKKFEKSKSGSDQSHLFKQQEELVKAKRLAENAFLNVVNLMGGFFAVTKDYEVISKTHVKLHQATAGLAKTNESIRELTTDRRQLAQMLEKKGQKPDSNSKYATLSKKITELEATAKGQKAELNTLYAEVEKLRDKYRSTPDFDVYEKHRNDGIDLARLSYNEMRSLRKEMQMIFQDPYSSLNPRMTVGQIISEGVTEHKFYNKSDEGLQDYTIKTMQDCGLAAYMIHRYPHQFSGGQRQRIGIARALALKPRFVVCDEAVSALDVSIQSQIINLLQDLKEKENLTYMFISHDLSVVKYISDRIAIMYLGNIVELADSSDIFRNPLHPYTEALLQAIPTTDAEPNREVKMLEGDIPSPIKPPKGCKFHTRCRYCMDVCKEVTPEFIELEKNHWAACHYRSNEQK